jgi:pyruvate/2-oxoacid:ferredoxin oxidoreductase beta subunit
MEHWFSINVIRNALMLVATVVVASGSVTDTPKATDPAGTAVSTRETGPTVLAQYNPCPNGRCR